MWFPEQQEVKKLRTEIKRLCTEEERLISELRALRKELMELRTESFRLHMERKKRRDRRKQASFELAWNIFMNQGMLPVPSVDSLVLSVNSLVLTADSPVPLPPSSDETGRAIDKLLRICDRREARERYIAEKKRK